MTEYRRHNFKKMKIWILSMEIVKQVFDITDTFPTHEKFGLKSQMDRCSVSIPSNIAEGSSRTNKSFRHFIDIALGSSFELQTQLLLAQHRNYITIDKAEELENKIEEFQRMTMSFQNTLTSE